MSFLIASGHVEVEAKTDKAMSSIAGIVGALGALGPVAGVAAAGLAAAGAGVAAFGVAAGKQVADLKKASDAQAKYQGAVDKSGKSSAEAIKAEMAYQQTLAKMPRATREASAAFSALKDSYSSWSDALAGDTMPVFTRSFQLFQALLPKTTGLVKGTSAELNRLITLIAGGVNSPGFDAFMVKFTDFSVGSIHVMINGLMDLSRAVGGFAAGGGFDDFIATAREAGPLLGSTLANLAGVALKLVSAGGDLGISMLTVANAFAKLANSVPSGVLSTFVQLYSALKLVSLGVAAVNTVVTSSAVARMGAYFALMRTAGVAPTLRATAGSMTAVQKAGLGLGVLAVAAIGISKLAEKARGAPPDVDRLATSLKQLSQTGRFSGELQKTFGDLDGLVDKVKKLHTEADKANNTAFGFRIPGLDDAGHWISNKINDMVKGSESLSALKDDFKSLDTAMAGMVSSGYGKQAAQDFDVMRDALKGAGYSTKDINELLPKYRDAVAGVKAEQQLAAQGMGLFGEQAQATKTKLDEQKASADGLRASIQALNDVNRASLGGMIGFEASIDAAAKAAKENAGSLHMVNGELDLNSPKAQAAATALSDLGAKTDAATASAREGGASWEKINGIYSRGRDELIKYAQQMGLSKSEAGQLADSILKIPDKKSLKIEMRSEDAIAGLDSVIAKMKAAPNAKSVTVKALTADAVSLLESLGLKVKQMHDGQFKVTVDAGSAKSNLAAVQAARDALKNKAIDLAARDRASAAVREIQRAIAALRNKTVTVTTVRETIAKYSTIGRPAQGQGGVSKYARGGQVRGYAGGGDVQMFPGGGYVSGPGSGTSDSILGMFASGAVARVSDTEYVMRAAAVSRYGVGFMDAINSGRLRPPGFAKGGKLTAKQKAAQEAAKKQAAAEKTAKSGLTSDFGISGFGTMAGYKRDPFEKSLGVPASVSDLVTSLNEARGKIKAASHGKTESSLLKRLDSSGKALIANQKKLEGVNKALESAKGKLDDLKGKFDSLKTSVSSSLVGFGNITKIGKYGTSPDTLIKQLSSDAGRTTEFAKQLEQLKGKGLNAQSISEIAQAGVTGGGMATAQSLLKATPQQIAEINALEKQLQASADKAGTVTADAMYGAGVRAAEGLVKGLTAQQSAIEAAMMTIAKAMEASIKKALGIRSPSKVMEPIGDYSFQGVEQGWVKRMARGNTLISGSNLGLRVRPAVIGAGAAPAASAMAPMVNLTATFNTMTLPAPTERKAFAVAMAKDINDALFDYQKERRR